MLVFRLQSRKGEDLPSPLGPMRFFRRWPRRPPCQPSWRRQSREPFPDGAENESLAPPRPKVFSRLVAWPPAPPRHCAAALAEARRPGLLRPKRPRNDGHRSASTRPRFRQLRKSRPTHHGSGWGTWIRTKAFRVRVGSSTAKLSPKRHGPPERTTARLQGGQPRGRIGFQSGRLVTPDHLACGGRRRGRTITTMRVGRPR